MPDYTPVHNPGHELTLTASSSVTGGQLVGISGVMQAAPVGANSAAVIGTAAYDAAAGQRVTIHANAFVHESTAAGAVTAGQDLTTGAAGTVAARGSGPNRVGIALTSAANGQAVRWVQTYGPPSPKATGATAGSPGSFTPSGSTTPTNLADLSGVTANPTTTWTTGQRVVLGDASSAYWTGTAWAAGSAP